MTTLAHLIFAVWLAVAPTVATTPPPPGASAPAVTPIPASGPSTKPPTPGGARATTAPAAATKATKLPAPRPVDAILTDVIAAVGGAAALRGHRSVHTKIEITFTGLGITGTAEHYATVGDKALTITEIPNLASTREGGDGTRFWSEDPINGLRVLEGVEAEQARIEAAWNAELRLKELFPKIQVENQRGEDGAVLECLILAPKIGAVMTNCFDAKTHLMAVQKGTRSGPQGDMPFTARLSDWRSVGDVKMAYATDMQVGPLSFTGRVTSVEMDVPLDPKLFAVPTVTKAAKPDKADKSPKTAKSSKAAPSEARPASSPARP